MNFWPCIIFATTVVKGYMQENKARHNGDALFYSTNMTNYKHKQQVHSRKRLHHFTGTLLKYQFARCFLTSHSVFTAQSIRTDFPLVCSAPGVSSVRLQHDSKHFFYLTGKLAIVYHIIFLMCFVLQNEIRRGKGSCMKRARFKCAARHIAYHKCLRA